MIANNEGRELLTRLEDIRHHPHSADGPEPHRARRAVGAKLGEPLYRDEGGRMAD